MVPKVFKKEFRAPIDHFDFFPLTVTLLLTAINECSTLFSKINIMLQLQVLYVYFYFP